MTPQELAEYICEKEHMGVLPGEAVLEWRGVNTLRLSWNAKFEGKIVPQYAEFNFTTICLDAS